MTDDSSTDRRRDTRHIIRAQVEFVLDGRTMEATAIDISEDGLAFEVEEAPTVSVAVVLEQGEVLRRARLKRLVQTEDGRYRFGLEFVDGATADEG